MKTKGVKINVELLDTYIKCMQVLQVMGSPLEPMSTDRSLMYNKVLKLMSEIEKEIGNGKA